jgi:hypothetical protein
MKATRLCLSPVGLQHGMAAAVGGVRKLISANHPVQSVVSVALAHSQGQFLCTSSRETCLQLGSNGVSHGIWKVVALIWIFTSLGLVICSAER